MLNGFHFEKLIEGVNAVEIDDAALFALLPQVVAETPAARGVVLQKGARKTGDLIAAYSDLKTFLEAHSIDQIVVQEVAFQGAEASQTPGLSQMFEPCFEHCASFLRSCRSPHDFEGVLANTVVPTFFVLSTAYFLMGLHLGRVGLAVRADGDEAFARDLFRDGRRAARSARDELEETIGFVEWLEDVLMQAVKQERRGKPNPSAIDRLARAFPWGAGVATAPMLQSVVVDWSADKPRDRLSKVQDAGEAIAATARPYVALRRTLTGWLASF